MGRICFELHHNPVSKREQWLFFKDCGHIYIHRDSSKVDAMKKIIQWPVGGIKEKHVSKLVRLTLLTLFDILFAVNRDKFHQRSTAGIVGRTRVAKFLNTCMEHILYGQSVSTDYSFENSITNVVSRFCSRNQYELKSHKTMD